MDRRQRELYSKQQHLLREQRFADQERLLGVITGELLNFWIGLIFVRVMRSAPKQSNS